jgi:hypothetical protein
VPGSLPRRASRRRCAWSMRWRPQPCHRAPARPRRPGSRRRRIATAASLASLSTFARRAVRRCRNGRAASVPIRRASSARRQPGHPRLLERVGQMAVRAGQLVALRTTGPGRRRRGTPGRSSDSPGHG